MSFLSQIIHNHQCRQNLGYDKPLFQKKYFAHTLYEIRESLKKDNRLTPDFLNKTIKQCRIYLELENSKGHPLLDAVPMRAAISFVVAFFIAKLAPVNDELLIFFVLILTNILFFLPLVITTEFNKIRNLLVMLEIIKENLAKQKL